MSEHIVIGWHRLLWQMVRHFCGPNRAIDHELARRYDKKMARVRDAWLREHAKAHWTCIVAGCDEPATHPRGPFCSQHGWDDARAPSG